MHIHGGCHCGNLRLALHWPATAARIPARACGCAFCVKHGGVWTSHPAARLAVSIRDAAHVGEYAFATRTATFHVCTRCGVVPFVTCEVDGRAHAVVNVNVLEDLPADRVDRAPVSFEGEDVDARLARRARNWIAEVTIERAAAPARAASSF